jgi:small-conductance mechanosensitive channel
MSTTDIWSAGSTIFENGFLYFLIHALVTWAMAFIVVKMLRKAMQKSSGFRKEGREIQLKFAFQTLRFIIYALAIFSILGSIKPLSSIGKAALGATSIMAVAVSLAAQESFGNYISGFFLAIYQPFKVGDFITLSEKGISGEVQEITMRHTVLHTADNTVLIVPNSVMNTAIIEDKAAEEINYVKWMTVAVSYDSDLELVRRIITQTVLAQPEYIDERTAEQKAAGTDPILVRLDEFQDSGLLIRFKVVCSDFGTSFLMASHIREQILEEFRRNGVVIPYPTRTVLNGGVPDQK